MAKTGRPKQIPALRIISATHRTDRHGPAAEIQLDGDVINPLPVEAPDHLSEEGKRHWAQLRDGMAIYGLEAVDAWSFAELCELLADCVRGHRALVAMKEADPASGGLLIRGSHGPQPNPLQKMVGYARRDALAMATAMGLTPLVRGRIGRIDNGSLKSANQKKYFSSREP